jgi:UDP-N-acetylmuramate--alanine ligase
MRKRGHRDASVMAECDAEDWVRQELEAGHVVLMMGAGSIGALVRSFRDALGGVHERG